MAKYGSLIYSNKVWEEWLRLFHRKKLSKKRLAAIWILTKRSHHLMGAVCKAASIRRYLYESPKKFHSSFQFPTNLEVGRYFWNMPQAPGQVGDFIPAHLCSEIMKEASRNCTCQIRQELKAGRDHFDSFQQSFCWSPMLLPHYIPGEVMGEQWIMFQN